MGTNTHSNFILHACGWHRSHILSRHRDEWLRTLDSDDFPHERPQLEDHAPRENGTRDPARFGLVVLVSANISSSLMSASGKQC
jgi:hypothetical protein